MSHSISNIEEFVQKVKAARQGNLDLSADEDLSIAVMNLISLEEHFFFSGEKTGDPSYYDLLREVREIRKVMLKKLLPTYNGEDWCISKHLLASSMRLMEVGTKQLGAGQQENSREMFSHAFKLYGLFWAVASGTLKGRVEIQQSLHDTSLPEGKTIADRFSALVKKALDCCRE